MQVRWKTELLRLLELTRTEVAELHAAQQTLQAYRRAAAAASPWRLQHFFVCVESCGIYFASETSQGQRGTHANWPASRHCMCVIQPCV